MYCPPSATQTIKRNSDYKLSMDNVYKDYTGSASITDPAIKALNNDYFTKGYTSTNINMRAVAYMLDTDVWSVYAGDKAEYAVGGPSIELFLKSYNEKYGTKYVAEAISTVGYKIGLDSASSDNITLSQTDDLLYVIPTYTKASGMWLASPANNNPNYNQNYLMYIGYKGEVNSTRVTRF